MYSWRIYLVMSHSENFVGHTGVQEVFDISWCGENTHKVSLLMISVFV
jgi:hypothetical protein